MKDSEKLRKFMHKPPVSVGTSYYGSDAMEAIEIMEREEWRLKAGNKWLRKKKKEPLIIKGGKELAEALNAEKGKT